MSIFIVDENFFIFQVVDGLVVDIINWIGVVQSVWRRLLPKMRKGESLGLRAVFLISN